MSMRNLVRAGVLLASVITLLAMPASASGAATVKLRVLGPDFDLTERWFVTGSADVPTSPKAKCFVGGSGGSGDPFHLSGPTALGAVKNASNWDGDLLPFRITDEFGFGLGVCGFGGHNAVAESDSPFWYLKVNHEEPTTGGDQVELEDGDEVLWYLAPSNFPNPNPPELVIDAPASAQPGVPFAVTVTAWSCTTDFPSVCTEGPANNAQVKSNGVVLGATNPSGIATVTLNATAELRAVRGADLRSGKPEVCVEPLSGDQCPPADDEGRKIVGRDKADMIDGTEGWDRIRGRAGSDLIDISSGGEDIVRCGDGSNDKVILATGDTDDTLIGCEKVVRV